jgi:hypothetical protein
MSTPNTPCAHLVTTGRHTPVIERTHGWMHADVIDCVDCGEKVVLRVYDDHRDAPFRRLPLTWGENLKTDDQDGSR